MKSRHESMGGRVEEVNALENLEGLRQKLIDRCSYNNEKNWVASVACMNRVFLSKVLFYSEMALMMGKGHNVDIGVKLIRRGLVFWSSGTEDTTIDF